MTARSCFLHTLMRALRKPVLEPKSFLQGKLVCHITTVHHCSEIHLLHKTDLAIRRAEGSGGKWTAQLDLRGKNLVLSLGVCIYQGAISWKEQNHAQRFGGMEGCPLGWRQGFQEDEGTSAFD